ncbi:MAG: hypothetical protein IRY85_13155, partial [Micromonosporaceae bacterium]|nr:hypothetical protein [Micromonosporaceae bacterium]
PEMGARYRRNRPYGSSLGAPSGAGFGGPTPGGDVGTGTRAAALGGAATSGAATGGATAGAVVTAGATAGEVVTAGATVGEAVTGGAVTSGAGVPTSPRLSAAELWDAVDRGDDPTRD